MTNTTETVFDLYASTSRDLINSDFILALVPVPARPSVRLRAGYLSNTGHRPSNALTIAVNEWRKGHLAMW
jgi:hypothetical protein